MNFTIIQSFRRLYMENWNYSFQLLTSTSFKSIELFDLIKHEISETNWLWYWYNINSSTHVFIRISGKKLFGLSHKWKPNSSRTSENCCESPTKGLRSDIWIDKCGLQNRNWENWHCIQKMWQVSAERFRPEALRRYVGCQRKPEGKIFVLLISAIELLTVFKLCCFS